MKINVTEDLIIKSSEYYKKDNILLKDINIYIIKDKYLNNLNTFFDYINNNTKEYYLGIDFEFNNINNKREVALIQINYENEFILMFDPSNLNNKLKTSLKKIFFNNKCIKILHGGESLDIKYLFDDFFSNLKERKKFINNLYDTKFICEYKNIRDNTSNKKCKIYQLILKSGLINESIYNKLIDNEEKMGPIYNIIINVNNMSKELINYTLFDVFYLISLTKKLLIKLNNDEKNLINFFLYETLLKKEIIERDINILNLFSNYYFLDYNNNRYTITNLLEYYNDILVTSKYNFNIINQIPFFKKLLKLLLKKIIITDLVNLIYIYKNKVDVINNNIISKLMSLEYYCKNEVFENFQFFIRNDIKKLI